MASRDQLERAANAALKCCTLTERFYCWPKLNFCDDPEERRRLLETEDRDALAHGDDELREFAGVLAMQGKLITYVEWLAACVHAAVAEAQGSYEIVKSDVLAVSMMPNEGYVVLGINDVPAATWHNAATLLLLHVSQEAICLDDANLWHYRHLGPPKVRQGRESELSEMLLAAPEKRVAPNVPRWIAEKCRIRDGIEREHVAALKKLPVDIFQVVGELRGRGIQWSEVAKIMKVDHAIERTLDGWKTWYATQKKERAM